MGRGRRRVKRKRGKGEINLQESCKGRWFQEELDYQGEAGGGGGRGGNQWGEVFHTCNYSMDDRGKKIRCPRSSLAT
jgi:hypothetical protein